MNKLIVLSIVPTSIAPRGPADVLSDPHRTAPHRRREGGRAHRARHLAEYPPHLRDGAPPARRLVIALTLLSH